MSSPYRFAIAALDKRELQQTSALLQTVFPHALHLTPAHLGWLYTANPDGPAIACNAWHGSELVGHMAGVPFCARYCGEDLRGMYLMNGSIHPEHRRRRLQSTISETMFEHAVGQGGGAASQVCHVRPASQARSVENRADGDAAEETHCNDSHVKARRSRRMALA